MADSIREQTLQAIVAILDGDSKPAGSTVHRSWTRQLEDDDLPSFVVYPRPEQTEERANTLVDRRLGVRIECRAVASAGQAPDAATDPLTTWVVKALVCPGTSQAIPAALDNLVHMINEKGTTWAAVEMDRVYAAAAVDLEVHYQTLRVDPESAS